jgi:uncharacterized LabA/DUF88 family protein
MSAPMMRDRQESRPSVVRLAGFFTCEKPPNREPQFLFKLTAKGIIPRMITWLIDMGYIVKASKSSFKLDYIVARKLIEDELKDSCQAAVFNSVDKRFGVDRGLAQFYHTIQQAGFTVNLYQMEGGSQKQVDVALASHGIWRAAQGDTIVLTSGDVDFLPACRIITEAAKRKLILFTYDFGVHSELVGIATEHWLFEDYPRLEKV